ncbi:ankyrin repeat-containing domain protein [Aspergillus granulosus]|uniref:Ankyrin repeat-containing domain protein n=1 Tax=Aspergillus granulosus TaxID=176169 RepID=A0ABR4HQ67_9EURO
MVRISKLQIQRLRTSMPHLPNEQTPGLNKGLRFTDMKLTDKTSAKTFVAYTEADVNAFAVTGAKVWCAIKNNDEKGFYVLLEQKCDWNTPLPDGSRLLHIAAELGRVAMLKTLLEHKVEVIIQDAESCTPLYLAAQNGHTEAVKVLVSVEANFRPSPRTSTLEMAAERGDEYD